MKSFSDYRIPPSFFGPLQYVSYQDIGYAFKQSVDEAEFIIRTPDTSDGRSLTMADYNPYQKLLKVSYYRDSVIVYYIFLFIVGRLVRSTL